MARRSLFSSVVLSMTLLLAGLPAGADELRFGSDDTVSYKEPRTVGGGIFFAAVFPGSIVHGSGNYYAGANTAGAIMTGAEIVGGAAIVAGIAMGGFDFWTHEEDKTGEAFVTGGVILFFGSWVADIISTPFQVQRYNTRLKQRGMEFGLTATPPSDNRPATFGLAVRF